MQTIEAFLQYSGYENPQETMEDCIFVDNSVQNLLAARELGMQIVLFNRDGELYDGNVVNSFKELDNRLCCA